MEDLQKFISYQLTHLYHHFFDEGFGMRQMVDYYYVLGKSEESDGIAEGTEAFGFVEVCWRCDVCVARGSWFARGEDDKTDGCEAWTCFS